MLSKRKLIDDLVRQLAHINKRLNVGAPIPPTIKHRLETQRDVYQSMLDNIKEGAYDA